MLHVSECARVRVSALFVTQLCKAALSVVTTVRDVTEETRRVTGMFYDPHFLRCEALFDVRNMLEYSVASQSSGVPGGVGVLKPPPEILKALQNRAKLNPICENC